MRRVLFLTPLILFLGLAVYLGFGLTRDARIVPSALIDQPVPEFALPPLLESGKGLATADLKGRVALVNVFASWCVPCRAEHPIWIQFAKDQKAPLYGINWKDKRETATRWLKELGNPYTGIGFDGDNRAGIEWGVYGAPETYIVDREGRIRYKHIGPIFAETMSGTIIPLIRELEGEK
ncbi:MAG: DsbE family thiol:disulfide interchange protein [Alphaproteobacteria bacterium]|nr:DsbE family thiol:disulfide interchange protein [Alphaproteobacteria bacterium]